MNKRDAAKLKVGDLIRLKHNLGEGNITKIAMTPEECDGEPGRYPMIQYMQVYVGTVWCTYRVIETVHPGLQMRGVS